MFPKWLNDETKPHQLVPLLHDVSRCFQAIQTTEAAFRKNTITVIKLSISPLSGFFGCLGLSKDATAACLASLWLRVGAFLAPLHFSPVACFVPAAPSLILICSPVFQSFRLERFATQCAKYASRFLFLKAASLSKLQEHVSSFDWVPLESGNDGGILFLLSSRTSRLTTITQLVMWL